VLLAGCGSSSYTKQDYISRADAICSNAIRQLRSVVPTTAASSGSAELGGLAGYLTQVLPVVETEASQLRAVPHPHQAARDRLNLARFLDAVSRNASNWRAFAAAAKRGDPHGVANAEAVLNGSSVSVLAARYGLRACGTAGATVVQRDPNAVY
jgi:hypothetical protein